VDRTSELTERSDIDLFRIVLYTRGPTDIVAGFARHEMEHVRQQRQNPPGMAISSVVQNAIRVRHGGRSGSGKIYNLNPREVDANAAASQFVARHFEVPFAERIKSPHVALFRDYPPPDPETLLFRAFCFAFLFEPEFSRELKSVNSTPTRFFTEINASFVEAWAVLGQDADLAAEVEIAIESEPGPEQIRAAGARPGNAWERTFGLYAQAHKRALETLDWTGPVYGT
jgi:hypothetical protein